MKSIFLLLLCTIAIVFAEVTVLKAVQTIYDRSPKLRIKGSGFDADEHSLILDLAATGQASLRVDKDFLITKDDDGLILKLLSGRKWVNLDGRNPPVALILSGVRFASNPNQNLLLEPVIIANVLATPTVKASEDIIYTTATNELRINVQDSWVPRRLIYFSTLLCTRRWATRWSLLSLWPRIRLFFV